MESEVGDVLRSSAFYLILSDKHAAFCSYINVTLW